mgnify:CR=1 FL=1
MIYCLYGYIVHSKLCLIFKKKDVNVDYYTQIGTGNYNEKTARLYTDLSLMTADPKIGTEAARVFQALAMGETVEDMDHLLVAPKCLQNKVLAMRDRTSQSWRTGIYRAENEFSDRQAYYEQTGGSILRGSTH